MRDVDAIRDKLREVAEKIDTGAGDVDIARALVVFNLSDREISGAAVLEAEIGWPADRPMPGVDIVRYDGLPSQTEIRVKRRFADPKGRPNRIRVAFDLIFTIDNIPPRGWQTYRATYSEPADRTLFPLHVSEDLIVIETLFHPGSLSPRGTERNSSVTLP